MTENSKNFGSNKLLDQLIAKIPPDFGRTDPDLHYWVFAPAIVAQLGAAIWHSTTTSHSSLAFAAALFASGIAIWTFTEYVLHRFSFHSASEHPIVKPFNSGLHKLHHAQPASKEYVAAPLILAIPVYILMFGVFWLISGTIESAAFIGSGFAVSFLFYEHVHFMSHQHSPKTGVMKFLKKHHMLHHFGDKERKFGVTSPLWDHIFRTYEARPKVRAARSAPNSMAS